MAATLILPFFTFGGTGAESRCLSLFHAEDMTRKQAILDALSCGKTAKTADFSDASGDRSGEKFIVRFADHVPEERILSLVKAYGGELLSDSKERVFSLRLTDADAFEKAHGGELLYCCPDRVLETFSLTDDPYVAAGLPEYEQLKLPELWSTVTCSSDVVVAVLDTGIDRTHEDFSGTTILDGYDFVEKHAVVGKDSTGHGTAVTGLIAATANNGVGTAGVAYGVKILPVRIAAGSVNIYSSDLVNGLRFAADAGAQIVNLSFGGYTFSAAENDAIRYARSKGCILVASAGNGGLTDRGTEDCYPASYEGVISVGSCDAAGVRSAFSQRSAAVDILMPGENLLLLGVTDGKSEYLHDDGTSYSAAIFSGLAALALSALQGDVRFGGEETESLVNGLGEWKLYDGWGAVDAPRLLRDVNLPQITGVRNGMTYIGKVTIGFNRGTAMLDGEELSDGETVYGIGKHRLTVSDVSGSRTIEFRISYIPASYKLEEKNGLPVITYSGGTATLDGLPYQSGVPVDVAGRHTFVLTDLYGDKTTEVFLCDPALPTVSGVEDGMTYDAPVRICVTSGGEFLFDGKPAERTLIVCTDGTHTLTLTNGSKRKELTFTLQTGVQNVENDLSRCGIILDETHGWYAVYGELLAGLRLYSLADGAYLGFVDTGCVQGYAFDGDELLVFGEWQFNRLDAASLATETPVCLSFPLRCDGFALAGEKVLALSENELYEVDRETGETTFLCHAEGKELYSDGETVLLIDPAGGTAYTLDAALQETNRISLPLSDSGQRKLFAGGMLFCGRNAWDLTEKRVRFGYAGYALTVKDGVLYTTEGVYELSTGNLLGEYGAPVSGITFGNGQTFLCGYAGGIRSYAAGTRFYAEASLPLPEPPEHSEPFSEYTRLYGTPSALCAGGSSCLLAFETERTLLLWNGENCTARKLPLSPVGAALSGNSLCAWSADLVWMDGLTAWSDKTIRNCFYSGGELYVLTDRLMTCKNGVLTDTGIEADAACGKGTLLAYRKNGLLTLRKDGKEIRTAGTSGALMTDGETLLCGRTVYRSDGTAAYRLSNEPLAVSGGCVLTTAGMVRLSTGDLIGEGRFGTGLLAALGDQCGLLLCENDALIRSDYKRRPGTVMRAWDAPLLLGCDEGGLYDERTELIYDRGVCLLDGSLWPSGTLVAQPGEHTLTLLLPCGIVVTRHFSVIPALRSISFVNEHYHLAVGETASLHIRYLPTETSSVPLSFAVEGDCIELQGDRFVAVREGTAVIRAQTADGKCSALCDVVVDGDLLRFAESSGYVVDRERKTLSRVSQGTTEEQLRSYLLTEGKVVISDETLRTGSTVTLIGIDGDTHDVLTVAVTGDLDGDGFLTAEDLRLLQALLQNGQTPSAVYALAADLNGSGSVTDRDARELAEWVLFARGASERTMPEVRGAGKAGLFVQTSVCAGDTVRVTVLLSGCGGASAVSGRVFYDTDRLEFTGCTSYGTDLQSSAKKTWASFVLLGTLESDALPAVTLEFRAKDGTADETVVTLKDVVIAKEKPFSLPGATLSFPIGTRVYGETALTLTGATEPFDPEVHAYTVYLPYGTAGLLYDLRYPEGCVVETENTLFESADELNAVFRFRYADGGTDVYTVRGFRSVEPPQSSDCNLKTLNIEGFPFAFDPAQTEYRISVPYEVSSVTLHWAASDPKATVFCGDTNLRAGKENLITVTVIAEDGARQVYRLYVFRAEAPQTSSEEESGEHGSLVWLFVLPLLAAVAAGGIWWSKQSRKDKNENGTV